VVGLQASDPLYVSYEKNFPNQPTALSNPELMTKQKWHHGHNQSVHNGIPRIGFMKGGKSALWVDEEMTNVFLEKTLNFIEQNHQANQPFFLYYALQQPHVQEFLILHLLENRAWGAWGCYPRSRLGSW
jgi:hypothetical protein